MLKLSTELSKRVSQLKSQLSSFRRRLPTNRRELNDWLYDRDITKRRIKYYARLLGFFILSLMTVLLLASLGTQILVWLKTTAQASIGLLYYLGEQLQVDNPGEFVTIIVAEVVALFGTGLLNIMIIRRLIKQPEPPSPDIVIEDGGAHIGVKNKSRIFTLLVSNRGNTAALSCQARITFDSLDRRDILEIPKVKSRINAKTFDYISLNKCTLPWFSWPHLLFPQKPALSGSTDIRAGDDAEVAVLVFVPAKRKIPAHFEILSTIKEEVTACLRPKHFYGKVKVTPLNGEPKRSDFQITRSNVTHEWYLELI